MKTHFVFLFTFIFSLLTNLKAQNIPNEGLDPSLQPFYHGVASGDPLSDRVIIWTRVSPTQTIEQIKVNWEMAIDPAMKKIVKKGKIITNLGKDYTVKVDVTGLQAGTTYYYRFLALGKYSIIGRTKTTPKNSVDHLRFAVVSCSNYEGGFFNAYGKIAQRPDLDAVIHLGDYIYEYGMGSYGDSLVMEKRKLLPKHEIVSLSDYRTRYSLYRLDPDLRKAHQQHPFIAVWDDHETANDAYKDGAENHNANEGLWQARREAARQVYAEWMPIRGEAKSIYRVINYGDLADLILLDTRLEGREKQIRDITNPELYNENRTILGLKQREWFLSQLKNSKAKWKIVGNQVVFAEFNVGWAAFGLKGWTAEQLEGVFLDIWDGYPAERSKIIQFLKANQINNTVFITGDVHTSFAFDIAQRPSVFSEKGKLPDYEPNTGEGSVAVEFVTPSITSDNFDENKQIGLQRAKLLEYQINKTLPAPPPNNVNPNPHMKFVDLIRHGYFILDLKADKAQADWYFMETIKKASNIEVFGEAWFTQTGQNHLQKADKASSEKAVKPVLAPER
jgi:alkaline phosphatase D